MKSRIHRLVWIAVVGLIASLAGPVAPASAAPSPISGNLSSSGSSVTPLQPTRLPLTAGDTAYWWVCFAGAVARSGGTADSNIKLQLNTRTNNEIDWTGALGSFGSGLTDNCLVFTWTLGVNDTASQPLGVSAAVELTNSAQLTVGGHDNLAAASTNVGALSPAVPVDVTTPMRSSTTPLDDAASIAPGADLALVSDERLFAGVSAATRACNAGIATVKTVRDHGLALGDVVAVLQVGPGYDSGTGGITYFRITGVADTKTLAYAVGCSTESETITGGVVVPMRYITIAEDADTDKTITRRSIAGSVATYTSDSHGFEVGDTVLIEGFLPRELNGAFLVTEADTNTFKVNLRHIAAGSSPTAVAVTDLADGVAGGGKTARRVIEVFPNTSTALTYSSVAPFGVVINPVGTLPGGTNLHVRTQLGVAFDQVGKPLAAITDATTWNFGTGAAPASITNITSSTSDGFYRTLGGTAPSIQVRFNQNVTVDTSGGTPRLTLNADPSAVASYASGSGGKTLTFTYTIGAGHSTLSQLGKRLNVTGLQLNGGTISGVGPSIAVPASGATGSLNANKNIVIDNTAPMPMGFQPFPGAVGVQATSALTVMFPENMAAVATKKLYIKTLTPHTAATITTAALASNVATITTSAPHGLVAGNTVVIAGASNAAYNGSFQVASAT
ncbi:MAG: hypothetical protein ACKOAI_05050, partial [Acidimicrobiia bacterium]